MNHPSYCISCEAGKGYIQTSAVIQSYVLTCNEEGTYADTGVCEVYGFKCATCISITTNCLSLALTTCSSFSVAAGLPFLLSSLAALMSGESTLMSAPSASKRSATASLPRTHPNAQHVERVLFLRCVRGLFCQLLQLREDSSELHRKRSGRREDWFYL